jgi:hypothetical protein
MGRKFGCGGRIEPPTFGLSVQMLTETKGLVRRKESANVTVWNYWSRDCPSVALRRNFGVART